MPGEVPTGWTISPFSGVATVERGLTYSNEQECEEAEPGAVCVLRIPNVQQQRFAPHDLKYIRGVPAKQVQKYSVPRKSILMVGSNGNADRVGNCCFVDSAEQYLFASFLMRVVPDIARADAKFFYYLIAGGEVQAAITDAVAGTTGLKNISLEMLRSYPLALPPLLEQKKIAAILSSVDEAIQATQAVIDQTRRVKEGLLQDLLTRGLPGHTRFKQTEIGEIPESWEVGSLFQAADLQHGKSFPSSEYRGEGVRLVRPGNLHFDNMVVWDDEHTTCLPESYWNDSPEHRVGPGEVLMNLTAQSLADNFLGRVCMTDATNRCLLNQRIGRLTPKENIERDYLFWVLQGPQFRKHIDTRGQGSKVQHLYNRDLETSRLPLPSRTEQQGICRRLWDARAVVEANEELSAGLKRQKTGLLQDLLTGRVRVTP